MLHLLREYKQIEVMPNPIPCGPSPCAPVITQVPGPQGFQGAPGTDGATGQAGPAGPAQVINSYPGYGSSSNATFPLPNPTAALLALSPFVAQVVLPAAGTYLLFGRARFDASAGTTLTTQLLTTYLWDTSVPGAVANTTRSVQLGNMSAITYPQTVAEITTPVVAHTVTAGTTIQIWGGLNAPVGAGGGSIVCVDADIVAVKIA